MYDHHTTTRTLRSLSLATWRRGRKRHLLDRLAVSAGMTTTWQPPARIGLGRGTPLLDRMNHRVGMPAASDPGFGGETAV